MIHTTERFDHYKLLFVLNNWEVYSKQLNRTEEIDIQQHKTTLSNFYNRSRHGTIKVGYKQIDGKGRYFACKSLSLQNIDKHIRHLIAKDYYVDIDISNAHPVILSFLCKKYGFRCDSLDVYIKNRDNLLKKLNIDRAKAKKVYLALTNGGGKDYKELQTHTEHLKKYRDEMKRLHDQFATQNPKQYEAVKAKRIKSGRDYNHKAAYVNHLLNEMENEILMAMYEYFGKPENVVLCFDGLMLPIEDKENYDLDACAKFVFDKIGINIDLVYKDMDDGLVLENYVKPKINDTRLEFYTDFKNLIKLDNIYPEHAEEWASSALRLIEGEGKLSMLTRNGQHYVYSDGTVEKYDTWNQVNMTNFYEAVRVKCNIINPSYDKEFADKYFAMSKKDRIALGLSTEQIRSKTKRYLFTNLGKYCARLGDGYIEYQIERREVIPSYNKIEFFPYLKRLGVPPICEESFNMFTGFPLENVLLDIGDMKFEDTLAYKHMHNEFFNSNLGETNHFLDHVADIIQDGAAIKGTSHLFYSKQGCGKGWLAKLISKLLGAQNVYTITNTKKYFDSNFNKGSSNKLLKIFEEVSEKGSAFANHDRLKAEQTMEEEIIEPKGLDSYRQNHCARYWYFTNNENSLYVETDDRRHTLHKINPRFAQNETYFKPLWEELADEKFLKCAFEFFANRKYDKDNVRKPYETKFKQDQKTANLPNGFKFIIDYVQKNYNKVEDKNNHVSVNEIRISYKSYCEENGHRYHYSALQTQLSKLGLVSKRLRYKNDMGIPIRNQCYIINTHQLQEKLRDTLKFPQYNLIEECEELEEGVKVDDIGYQFV